MGKYTGSRGGRPRAKYLREWQTKNKEKMASYRRAYYARVKAQDPAYIRKEHLKNNYGITVEQYQQMLLAQEGKCAICACVMDKPNVDHCHATGKVRQLLCKTCNYGLGNFKDSLSVLEKAIQYLTRWNNAQTE